MVMDICEYPEGRDDPAFGPWVCGYYFVNHEEKSLFWLDLFYLGESPQWTAAPGVVEESHLGQS